MARADQIWHWLVGGFRGLVLLVEQQHADSASPLMLEEDLIELESYLRRLQAVAEGQREQRGDS